MVIPPSGRRRVMVGQTYLDSPIQQQETNGIDIGGANPNDVVDSLRRNQMVDQVDSAKDSQEREQEQDNGFDHEGQGSDLTDFIGKKLQSFGYPGRRLHEYKSKFVKQVISAEGEKEVEVTIPDSYYGKNRPISDEDFKRMVGEIKHKFGLFFTGAERSEGKLSIKFTSSNIDATAGEEEPIEDELSKVYGQPGSKDSAKQKSRRTAHTIHELIGQYKDAQIENLLGIIKGA
jgi:hypothetical protein